MIIFRPSFLFSIVTIFGISISLHPSFYVFGLEAFLYILLAVILFFISSFYFENFKIKKCSPSSLSFLSGGFKEVLIFNLLSIFTIFISFFLLFEIYNLIQQSASFTQYAITYREDSISGLSVKDNVNYIVRNAEMLAISLAVIGVWFWVKGRLCFTGKVLVVILISMSILIPVLMIARSGAIRSILVLFFFLLYIKSWSPFKLFYLVFILFSLFTVAGYFFGYGQGYYQDSIFDAINYFFVAFVRYIYGGYYAFSQLIDGNVSVYFPMRFISSLLGKVDGVLNNCLFCYEQRTISVFVDAGDFQGSATNVYSVFGAVYSNLGWLGLFYFPIIGALFGLMYSFHKASFILGTILLSFFVPALVLSFFSEYFFGQIPTVLRLVFILLIIYIFSRLRIRTNFVK